jgi:hypothetical protein
MASIEALVAQRAHAAMRLVVAATSVDSRENRPRSQGKVILHNGAKVDTSSTHSSALVRAQDC